MISGIGVDIIEVSRIQKAAKKWGDDFLKRIFTENELSYAKKRKTLYQHLAARFAAKEALVKAFGIGPKLLFDWREVEVVNNKNGKPSFKFSGRAEKLARKKMIKDALLSISHTANYAVANVVLTKTK